MFKKIAIWDTPVYLVGDLHTNYKVFKNELELLNLSHCYLFFLGDMSFKNYDIAWNQFKKLDNELYERNIISYVVRGNHDNPELWLDENKWPPFKSFRPIDSRARVDINGNRGIIVSGASSLNKELLEDGVSFWSKYDKPDMPYDMEDFGENLKNVDFIIGHSGPVIADFFKGVETGCEKFLDKGVLREDLNNEQELFRTILRRFRPKRWYCGHYHMTKDTKFVWDNWSDDGVIHLKILNKNEIKRIA